MKEEQYIESLFKKVREEETGLSYEEVSEQFMDSLKSEIEIPSSGGLFNKSYLIPFILFLILGSIAIATFSSRPNETKQVSTLQPMQQKTEIVTDEIKPQKAISPNNNINVPQSIVKEKATENIITKHLAKRKPITKTIQNDNFKVDNEIVIQRKIPKKAISNIPLVEKIEEEKIFEANFDKKIAVLQKSEKEKGIEAPTEKVVQPIRNLTELEQILEAALNSELLKNELFAKNRLGEFHQLVMQTNRKFDDLIDIQFEGKKVIVIATRYSGSFNIIGSEFIDIQEFMVSENKAFLEFIYNSIEVKIDLIKTDDGWVNQSASKDHKQYDYRERKTLIQLVLDHDSMKKIVLRDENGEFKPLSLLSNGHFSNMLSVSFEGNNLEIVSYKYNRAYNRKTSYAEVNTFQVKKKKAILKFSYNKEFYKVNYRLKNGTWSIRSFTKN